MSGTPSPDHSARHAVLARLYEQLQSQGSLDIRTVFEEVFGVSKLSDLVQAMVTGLTVALERKDFDIDMGTFGCVDDQICYGCAATCALQQLSGVKFEPAHGSKLAWSYEWAGRHYKHTYAVDIMEKWYDKLRRGGEEAEMALERWVGQVGGVSVRVRDFIYGDLPAMWDRAGVERYLPKYSRLVELLREEGL